MLLTVQHALKTFAADDQGTTAIEYGMIGAIMMISIIGVLTSVSGEVKSTYNSIQAGLAKR